MATSTTNLSLIKPAGSDKIRIAQINQNMDTLDAKIGAVGDTSLQAQNIAQDGAMAIVSTGNTHGAISAGQFVYVRNHGTLAEGLYKANSAISANATLSTSNVTHISSGGMNDLKEQIDSLNGQIDQSSVKVTDLNNCTDPMKNYYCDGNALNVPITSYLQIRVINASPGTNSYYSQIAMPMNSTTARMWIRTKSPTEWSPWTEVARKSDMDIINQGIAGSTTSYTVNIPRTNNGNYGVGLMFGSTSSSNGFLYIVFVPATASGSLTFIAVKAHPSTTFSGTFNGSTATITASATCYGGIRFLWIPQ